MLRHDDTTPPSQWVRALRGRLGLTQPEFGRLVGVHRVTVSRWETGASPFRGPHRARLNQIARAIGVQPIAPRLRPRGRVIHLPEEYRG
jgi:transcriptional regulator with XRE-family HTH domain